MNVNLEETAKSVLEKGSFDLKSRSNESDRHYWWEEFGCGHIRDERIAAKMLELVDDLGEESAYKALQSAVNLSGTRWKLAVDGVLEKRTLYLVNSHPNPDHLLTALKLCAVDRYLSMAPHEGLIERMKRVIQ